MMRGWAWRSSVAEVSRVAKLVDRVGEFVEHWGDVVLALVFTVWLQQDFWVTPPAAMTVAGGRGLGAVVLALITVPLAWRRRAPLAALFTFTGATLAGVLLLGHTGGPPLEVFLAGMLFFYSVGAHCDERRALLGGGSALALIAAFDLAHGGVGQAQGSRPAAWLVFAACWLVGRELRRRRRGVELLRERAAWLERDGEQQARAAVAEERARIARELHDVVAHSVSVMVVQAQAVQRVLEGEQAPARELLGSIETTGRQALGELRRMLGLLRRSDEQVTLAPQPGLDRLDELVEQVREAGLPVELVVEGEPHTLPTGVDLSAYRIVQEALTNTLRHAGPARAWVTVRYAPGELRLEIADNGEGGANGAGSGQGLLGMRERVALYGGELESGKRRGGGYLLSARLPLDGHQV